MANQFMRAVRANTGEKEVPHRMFEHRAMANLENVAEVRLVAARPGLGERHIANATRGLHRCSPATSVSVCQADAVIGQEAVEFRVVDGLPAHDVDGRLTDDLDIASGNRVGHAFFLEGF